VVKGLGDVILGGSKSTLGESSMERLESEYPTDEQIEEMFTAWEKDGKTGILKILRKRRREREESEATGKDSPERG
jgi:hypothetical protein